jgi:transcriptional regulator with XRE-family HTH domain
MGRAGKALKQVLESYNISQYSIAGVWSKPVGDIEKIARVPASPRPRVNLNQQMIDHTRIAVALGIERNSVYRWVHEIRDPSAETVVQIVKALEGINPAAAEAFIKLYLVDALENKE